MIQNRLDSIEKARCVGQYVIEMVCWNAQICRRVTCSNATLGNPGVANRLFFGQKTKLMKSVQRGVSKSRFLGTITVSGSFRYHVERHGWLG